jgi:hypothetical protein
MFGRRNRGKKASVDSTPTSIDITSVDNIVNVIKKGDLDSLKEILEQHPDLIEKTFKFTNEMDFCGSILHMAASYNQPELVKFLVTEKGMKVDKLSNSEWTPLHHAARTGASQAVQALLDLGANQSLKTSKEDTPYELCKLYCKDNDTKELLRPYHEAAKIKGTWESGSPDQITHEHDMPGHRFHLSETFELAAGRWTLITKDLQDGQLAPTVVKYYADMTPKEKEAFDQARARLNKANGVVDAETTETQKPESRPATPRRLITTNAPRS